MKRAALLVALVGHCGAKPAPFVPPVHEPRADSFVAHVEPRGNFPSVVGFRLYAELPPITFRTAATSARVRLYGDDGAIDPAAEAKLAEVLEDARDPRDVGSFPIDRRLLQLVFRAAHHFGDAPVLVVSGYRKARRRREGLHAEGHAIDFSLEGVPRRELANYLRTLKHVGVGEYIHPRTQYCHLDTRDLSYFWLDGTGPRRPSGTWRLPTLGLPARDRTWSPADDRIEKMVEAE